MPGVCGLKQKIAELAIIKAIVIIWETVVIYDRKTMS